MSGEVTKLKVIITGASGMVGEGVLLECPEHAAIEQVLIVNRKPFHGKRPKLKECIVPDFLQLDGVLLRVQGSEPERSTYLIEFHLEGIRLHGEAAPPPVTRSEEVDVPA